MVIPPVASSVQLETTPAALVSDRSPSAGSSHLRSLFIFSTLFEIGCGKPFRDKVIAGNGASLEPSGRNNISFGGGAGEFYLDARPDRVSAWGLNRMQTGCLALSACLVGGHLGTGMPA